MGNSRVCGSTMNTILWKCNFCKWLALRTHLNNNWCLIRRSWPTYWSGTRTKRPSYMAKLMLNMFSLPVNCFNLPFLNFECCTNSSIFQVPDFSLFIFYKQTVKNSGKFEFTVSAMKNLKLLFPTAFFTEFSTKHFPVISLPGKCMSITAIL